MEATRTGGPPSVVPGPDRRRTRRRCAVAGTLAVFAVLGIVLTVRPWQAGVGASDNGDGVRLYCGVGVAPETASGSAVGLGTFVEQWRPTEACEDPMPSAARFPLDLAMRGALRLSGLAWIYALAFGVVAGLTGFLATTARLSGAVPVAIVFAPLWDVDFTRFLVSTYGEPMGLLAAATVLSGLAAIAATARSSRRSRGAAMVVTAGGAALAVATKQAFVPWTVVACLGLVLPALDLPGRRRGPVSSRLPGLVMVVVLVGGLVSPWRALDAWQDRYYQGVNAFNVAYTFLLVEDPSLVHELGLPPAAAQDAGKGFWFEPVVPERATFIEHPEAMHRRAGRALVRHPQVAASGLLQAITATGDRQLAYLGSRRHDPGAPTTGPPDRGVGRSWPSVLSIDGLDTRWAPIGPVVVLLASLVAGAVALVDRWLRRHRRHRTIVGDLCLLAGASALAAIGTCGLSVVGDGYYELAKHVWLAAYALDVAALSLLAAAGVILATRRRRRAGLGPGLGSGGAHRTSEPLFGVEGPGA